MSRIDPRSIPKEYWALGVRAKGSGQEHQTKNQQPPKRPQRQQLPPCTTAKYANLPLSAKKEACALYTLQRRVFLHCYSCGLVHRAAKPCAAERIDNSYTKLD
jgi:hypothetical protein